MHNLVERRFLVLADISLFDFLSEATNVRIRSARLSSYYGSPFSLQFWNAPDLVSRENTALKKKKGIYFYCKFSM